MSPASPFPLYAHAAHIVRRALATLSDLCWWISHTGDPDLPPAPHVSVRTLHDAAQSLRALASDLDSLADRISPPEQARQGPPTRSPSTRHKP